MGLHMLRFMRTLKVEDADEVEDNDANEDEDVDEQRWWRKIAYEEGDKDAEPET